MEWLYGVVAAAALSLLINGAQALFSRSQKLEIVTSLTAVNERVEKVEKDLLANYVSKTALAELQKDMKKTLRMITNIQLVLARHFRETELLSEADDET